MECLPEGSVERGPPGLGPGGGPGHRGIGRDEGPNFAGVGVEPLFEN